VLARLGGDLVEDGAESAAPVNKTKNRESNKRAYSTGKNVLFLFMTQTAERSEGAGSVEVLRDMARCRATEQACTGTRVFTVSLQEGDPLVHYRGDVGAREFPSKLKEHFGPASSFRQIVLDWYWSPSGWAADRWGDTFFSENLAGMRTLLPPGGCVYFPFKLLCFEKVVVNSGFIQRFYKLSYVRKGDEEQVSLWRGTQQIDDTTMSKDLGKNKTHQEENYIGFGESDVRQCCQQTVIARVMSAFGCLHEPGEIVFIKLERLGENMMVEE